MTWLVTAVDTRKATQYVGRNQRWLYRTFQSRSDAERFAQQCILPDTPFAYATVECVDEQVANELSKGE